MVVRDKAIVDDSMWLVVTSMLKTKSMIPLRCKLEVNGKVAQHEIQKICHFWVWWCWTRNKKTDHKKIVVCMINICGKTNNNVQSKAWKTVKNER